MKKDELRQKLLQNRKPCPEKDSLILRNLLSLKEFKEADLLLTYISTEKEIDTRALIEKCFELGKRVAVPLTGVHEIEFYEIKSLAETRRGKFGIREPLKDLHGADTPRQIAQINKSSFCVCPALACDGHGFRLGYGKGYYDRFLSGFEGISAVLCYKENIIEIPVQTHDCAADLIITEGGIEYGR